MLNSRKGFTLIELLVVIAIIGILVSIVLVSYQNAKNAKDNDCDQYKGMTWTKVPSQCRK